MTTKSSRPRTAGALRLAAGGMAAALLAGLAADAHAGGMMLHTRGVRPTARGGAFVAGADDLGAMWFNPAGIAHVEERSFLFDVAYVAQDMEYQRVDPVAQETYAPVTNEAPGLPVPSVAVALPLNDRLTIAGGVYAPYAGLGKFPDDGPQRYSSMDLSESLLAVVSLGFGFKVSEKFRVGVTLQNMFFALSSTVTMSGCPGETVCLGTENPDWDALVKLTQVDWFSPSASAGLQWDVHELVTFGASAQAPFWIRSRGKVETKLPDSGFYNGATVEGDRADVSFTLPPAFRAGIEIHPGRWRIEAAVDAELWSVHDEMRITPKDVNIVNVPGVAAYQLAPVVLPRHFENSYAGSLGVEGQLLESLPLRVLAGYTYETAASPDEYLTVLTVDGNKQVFAGGLGYRVGRYALEAMFSYATMDARTVTDGQSPQLSPIRPNPMPPMVNMGTYKSSWLAAGFGVSGGF
jgi:long-chain fatty acid transport protein